MHTRAIFGGTFDPVHYGHIKISISIQSHFNFDSYYFLPCKMPTIKSPSIANPQQRIEMLQLAIKNHPQFMLDLREINRESPSYMVETLKSIRIENKDISLTLILGYDAFLSLPQWHQWKEIIQLANLLVINRSQFAQSPRSDSIKELLNLHQVNSKEELLTQSAGVIYFFDAGNYDFSSTNIKDDIAENKQIETKLPNEVYEYIKENRLYQRPFE